MNQNVDYKEISTLPNGFLLESLVEALGSSRVGISIYKNFIGCAVGYIFWVNIIILFSSISVSILDIWYLFVV